MGSIDKDHHLSLLPINTKGYILFLSFLTKDQSSLINLLQ